MYLYENAIIEDINSLFINSKVKTVIADSIDEALKRSAAEGEDKISLPLIILTGGDWNIDDANFYAYMKGIEFKRKDITTKTGGCCDKTTNTIAKSVNVIPFTPNYTMHIMCSSSRECDMLTREILFHYYMQPTLTVKLPYGIDEIHTFNINFDRRITKNQTYSGLVYRTLSFNLAGAYLWHNNTVAVIKEVDTDVKERYDK